jgi:phosphopantothenoylcysteine decarboxylase/phosphopantothenate--cysteine ligase
MYQACDRYFDKADITIMAAAVADYSPREAAPEKIKKKDATLQLELLKTRDILKSMGERKRDDQVLVGFALETNNEIEHSREKLKSKNADLIVLNSLAETGAGFGHDTNKVTILERNGGEYEFPLKTKNEVAKDIVDTIIRLYYAK